MVDPASGASEWHDRIFLYDGFSLVGAVSGAVGGEEECGRAPESLAPQAGFLRDASCGHVGAYAPLELPLQSPLLASIPLRETNLLGYSLSAIGDCPTFYLYRGERWDPDLGHYYLRARFYDANLGRFHTLDEYEGRTGEPLSLHKYLYAHANPVTGWDPSGRMTLTEAVGSVTQVAVNSSKSTSNALRLRFVFQKVGCYVFEEAVESIVIEAGVYTGRPKVMICRYLWKKDAKR